MFPEAVDLVVYINLNIRTDRRQEIEREFLRLDIPPHKILRWPAIRNQKNPALGCTLSHISVLEHIISLPTNIENILILEDDFNFVDNEKLVFDSLGAFLSYSRDLWDMVLLSYVVREREDYNELVSLSLRANLASGYLINRSSVPKFLYNFREGCERFMVTGDQYQDTLDSYWCSIMRERKCFYFNRPLGYQRKSYSNICNEVCERQSFVENEECHSPKLLTS